MDAIAIERDRRGEVRSSDDVLINHSWQEVSRCREWMSSKIALGADGQRRVDTHCTLSVNESARDDSRSADGGEAQVHDATNHDSTLVRAARFSGRIGHPLSSLVS